MALEAKQLNCPNCGGALEVKNERRAKSLICQYCGSQLDLTDPQYSVIGKTLNTPAEPRTPIKVGMTGEFDGKKYQAIGRVRYSEDDIFWDEWLLMTEDGEFKWLTEGEEGFTLYETLVPTNPVDPNTVKDELNLDGTNAELDSKGVGEISFLEGELTWKAKIGDRVNYLDADGPGGLKYSIEWTDEEVEFFKGRRQANKAVRAAFGLPATAEPKKKKGGGCFMAMVICAVILIFMCVIIAMIPSDDSGDSTDDGTTTTSTSSSGSSGGFFFFGGSGGSGSSSSGGGSIRGSGSSGGSSSGGGK